VVDRDGTVRDTYGHQDLAQPGAIAVDRFDRVYVADVFDRSIKMFSGGRMIASIPASEVGALEVSDLSINESNLLLADGAGARVIVLRIVPPAGK
jgi:hypothetical protein